MRWRNPTPLPLWLQRKTASQNQGDGRQVGESEGWGVHHLNPQVIHRYTHPGLVLTRASSLPHTHPHF